MDAQLSSNPTNTRKLALVALAATVAIVASKTLPVGALLLNAVGYARDAGPAGAAVFVLLYAASTALMLPGSVLTLAAGFLYGPLVGFGLVWIASNLGATLAFLLGRGWLRDTVSSWVAQRPWFAALDHAMGAHGLRLVLLIRLSPLFPFNLVNYALGLTRVSLRDYVFGSLVGMIPATMLYVYLGSTLTELGQLLSGAPTNGASRALFWLGLAATLVVTTLIGRAARAALDDTLESA